jgi:hypothetical protein
MAFLENGGLEGHRHLVVCETRRARSRRDYCVTKRVQREANEEVSRKTVKQLLWDPCLDHPDAELRLRCKRGKNPYYLVWGVPEIHCCYVFANGGQSFGKRLD